MEPNVLAKYIDHTVLKAEAAPKEIIKLCHEANEYGFAAVCVNACYVSLAKSLVANGIHVASVVGFPLGATSTAAKSAETSFAVKDGATEIDMVINVGWLKAGLHSQVEADIRAVVIAADDVPVKVIIEAALLSDADKVTVCQLAKTAGAAYVKTSTGFGPGGATIADVALMRQTVGPEIGVKASGGVRTLEATLAMIEAGASRIGTSSGVAIVEESKSRHGSV
ncbi:MAG: deoxyribose-phosphate aldolase [Bacillota bacterium]|nr:MAG: deoxyribose-phosphate aldolase [Bacillota bacterium]